MGIVLKQLGEKELELFSDPREVSARTQYRFRAQEYAQKIANLPLSLDVERHSLVEELNTQRLEAPPRARSPGPSVSCAMRRNRGRGPREVGADAPGEPSEIHHPVSPCRSFPRRNAGSVERVAEQLHRACVRADDGHRSPAAPADALLHRAWRARSAPLGFWSLFFIFLLYVTAPAYAVFAKWEVYSNLIGSNISTLPAWVAYWGKVGLVKIEDINGDGLLQLAELSLNTDVIVLATPEIAGLPYVVRAGGGGGSRQPCRPQTDCCSRFQTRCRTISTTR